MTQAKTSLFALLGRMIMAVLFSVLGGALMADSYSSERLQARLISAEAGIGPETRTISAGLDIKLAEDWKTYWRSPGEVGLPPMPDWTESTNVASVDFQYPAPTRFQAFGIENFGYGKQVLFPLLVTLKDAGKPAQLRGSVDLLVCEKVCVPETVQVSMDLQTGGGINFENARILADWIDRLPKVDPTTSAEMFVTPDNSELLLHIRSQQPLTNPSVFPEMGQSFFGAPTLEIAEGGQLIKASYPIFDYQDGPTLITVTDGNHAFEVTPTKVASLSAPSQSTSNAGLWAILGLALIGGLILNVMPCVLPVLSIKLTSALQSVERPASQVRAGFLASSLGILTFMWALAIILIGLRAMGQTVGWGIQFQSPYFLIAIITILVLFAANMAGVFEISLPHQMNSQMDKTTPKSGLIGDYLTGVFAALMATPCSAPFLGTAVAFALTNSASVILMVFTALGLGLSLPYLAVAVRPSLLGFLPKPGEWMIKLRLVLAVLLLATAVWLGFVLANTLGIGATLLVMALVGLGVLMIGFLRGGSFAKAAILPLAAAFAIPSFWAGTVQSETNLRGLVEWQTFQRNQIATSVADGQTIFVDVTADWCLTCKANKKLVLETEEIAALLNADNTIALQADWTKPNKQISLYLEMNDRFGIPFNIVYGPNAPNGIALPELLTKSLVAEAIAAAR